MKQIVLFILIRIALAALVLIVPAVIGFMLVDWLEPQFFTLL